MGEESTTPVYIGRYEDGKVVFEPLGEFEVIDHDITDVYPDDCDHVMVKPLPCIQTIMKQPITIRAFLRKKGLRGFYKAIGMPAYLRTEYLFPKKKKRGTARRKRKLRRYEQAFRAYIKEHFEAKHTPICEYIISEDELPAFAGPFEGKED